MPSGVCAAVLDRSRMRAIGFELGSETPVRHAVCSGSRPCRLPETAALEPSRRRKEETGAISAPLLIMIAHCAHSSHSDSVASIDSTQRDVIARMRCIESWDWEAQVRGSIESGAVKSSLRRQCDRVQAGVY